MSDKAYYLLLIGVILVLAGMIMFVGGSLEDEHDREQQIIVKHLGEQGSSFNELPCSF